MSNSIFNEAKKRAEALNQITANKLPAADAVPSLMNFALAELRRIWTSGTDSNQIRAYALILLAAIEKMQAYAPNSAALMPEDSNFISDTARLLRC